MTRSRSASAPAIFMHARNANGAPEAGESIKLTQRNILEGEDKNHTGYAFFLVISDAGGQEKERRNIYDSRVSEDGHDPLDLEHHQAKAKEAFDTLKDILLHRARLLSGRGKTDGDTAMRR